MISIIGMGNMGKRYGAILDYLGVPWKGVDKDADLTKLPDSDKFILSSSTEAHFDNLRTIAEYGKPVLCEKPITQNISELDDILNIYRDIPFRMVNQYEHLQAPSWHDHSKKMTYYNYFKTGKDTMYWDCINIIGLAKEKPGIHNNSPVWKCAINGHKLNIADMDTAYITEVKNFVRGDVDNKDYILKAHKRIYERFWV